MRIPIVSELRSPLIRDMYQDSSTSEWNYFYIALHSTSVRTKAQLDHDRGALTNISPPGPPSPSCTPAALPSLPTQTSGPSPRPPRPSTISGPSSAPSTHAKAQCPPPQPQIPQSPPTSSSRPPCTPGYRHQGPGHPSTCQRRTSLGTEPDPANGRFIVSPTVSPTRVSAG